MNWNIFYSQHAINQKNDLEIHFNNQTINNATETRSITKTKPKTKKQKTVNDHPENEKEAISTKQLLQSIEENFENNKQRYPVSFNNFSILMDLTKGHKNPISVISEITNDYDGVIKILEENYQHLSHRSMKTRFTKLRKKLKLDTKSDEMEIEDISDGLSDGGSENGIVE